MLSEGDDDEKEEEEGKKMYKQHIERAKHIVSVYFDVRNSKCDCIRMKMKCFLATLPYNLNACSVFNSTLAPASGLLTKLNFIHNKWDVRMPNTVLLAYK